MACHSQRTSIYLGLSMNGLSWGLFRFSSELIIFWMAARGIFMNGNIYNHQPSLWPRSTIISHYQSLLHCHQPYSTILNCHNLTINEFLMSWFMSWVTDYTHHPSSTILKPFLKCIHNQLKPYLNHTYTILKPYLNHTWTILEPYLTLLKMLVFPRPSHHLPMSWCQIPNLTAGRAALTWGRAGRPGARSQDEPSGPRGHSRSHGAAMCDHRQGKARCVSRS